METTEADRRTIKALREYGHSKRNTAAITGWSRPTVTRYEGEQAEGYDESLSLDWEDIEPAIPADIDPESVITPGFLPRESEPVFDGNDSVHRFDTGISLDKALDEDLLLPEELMYTFLDTMPFPVRDDIMEFLIEKAKREKQLIDPEVLKNDVDSFCELNRSSVEVLVREYKNVKQKYTNPYTDERTRQPTPPQQQPQNQRQQGQWTTVGTQQHNQR
jgi:hypothetical protein